MTIHIPDERELRSRAVPLEGVHNFRDIGGYETVDGRVTRERQLFRSDALHNLDAQARLRLDELDIRTVVDLRTEDERANFPDAVGERRILAHPIFRDVHFDPAPTDALQLYDLMIDSFGDELAAAVKAVAAPEALPAVVHCTAGKDRTGVVVALILAAVGVPDDVVAADFAATELFLTPAFVETLGERTRSAERGILHPEAGHMQTLLARIETDYRGVGTYLSAHGVTDEELARLRDELTTEA